MDKDFGALVIVRRLPHPGIVRLAGLTPDFSAYQLDIQVQKQA